MALNTGRYPLREDHPKLRYESTKASSYEDLALIKCKIVSAQFLVDISLQNPSHFPPIVKKHE